MSAGELRALRNPTALMQAVSKCLSKGQFLHSSGEVPTEKVAALAEKFCRRYLSIAGDSVDRSAARRVGIPVVNLFWIPLQPRGMWEFVLISDQELDGERLKDARRSKKSVRVLRGYYKAIRRPGSTSWTWVMTERHQEYWRRRLLWAVKSKNPEKLPEVIAELVRKVSLFSGVRRQVLALLSEARGAARSRGMDVTVFPASIPIMQFLKIYSGVSLAEQIAQIEAEVKLALQSGSGGTIEAGAGAGGGRQ